MSLTNQSNPSKMPLPVTALQATIRQWRLVMLAKSNTCKMVCERRESKSELQELPHPLDVRGTFTFSSSSTGKAEGTSCLLAKMSSVAPHSRSSLSSAWSSALQSCSLARSALSTTCSKGERVRSSFKP